jgi:hypothetical protein
VVVRAPGQVNNHGEGIVFGGNGAGWDSAGCLLFRF